MESISAPKILRPIFHLQPILVVLQVVVNTNLAFIILNLGACDKQSNGGVV
jgi:hypothetical protein